MLFYIIFSYLAIPTPSCFFYKHQFAIGYFPDLSDRQNMMKTTLPSPFQMYPAVIMLILFSWHLPFFT